MEEQILRRSAPQDDRLPQTSPPPALTPEQFRRMLEEALAADPNLARLILKPLIGTAFPIVGGACNSVEFDAAGSKTNNKLTKWSDASNCKITDSAVFESGGNVGIGAASTGAKLDVPGTFSANGSNGEIYTTAPSPYTATGVVLRAKSAKPYLVATLGTAGTDSAFVVYNRNGNKDSDLD